MIKKAFVITSISGPSEIIRSLSNIAGNMDTRLIVIGDKKSPKDFEMDGVDFYGIEKQNTLDFKFEKVCLYNSYTRKNIGYLIAMKGGAEVIIESDDDNIPQSNYKPITELVKTVNVTSGEGWINAYQHFTNKPIWPRGFPLELAQKTYGQKINQDIRTVTCPIQQSLANTDPDVDAVFRLLFPLPFDFDSNSPLALGKNSWCPFNSQNTVFYKCAFPLLYLPTYCSFRMTDIWRSFVAQRICWEYDWHVLFNEATMYQERNIHNYLKDFADEIPGYLNNAKIIQILNALSLSKNVEDIWNNLFTCYESLIYEGIFDKKELELLTAFKTDAEIFINN